MASLSPAAPRWARRPNPQDGVRDPGLVVRFNYGRPEYRRRIAGVGGVQREAALQAFRERTNVRPAAPPPPPQPTHGELRRGADGVTWRYDATKGKGQRLGLDNVGVTEDAPLSQKDLATQQWENRKRQLTQGGISAPDASLGAAQEYVASPNFTGPRNQKPRTAFTGPVNRRPGADQGLIAQIRERAKLGRPRVQY